ncbi:MAG: glucosaminidase domain-containing protein [Saprospiraceae bacterium]|nr:glucosaminidase domain-containing protein [Saprospiraceae bacterium]
MKQNILFYFCKKILAVMGKNKWYTEIENAETNSFRSTGFGKTKKVSNLPGAYYHQRQSSNSESFSLVNLFKAIKRYVLALKFLRTRASVSIFQRRTLLKFGFLACVVYYFFGANSEMSASLGYAQPGINWEEEAELGVANEPKKKPTNKEKKPTVKKEKPAPKRENDAAPVRVETIKGDHSAAYIRKFSGIARQEMLKYGVPASISLAQGLIESRAGTSKLAVQNNNHFGMKCFARNCRKGHCTNHTDDTHKDFFLKFNDPKLSWRAHSILISSGRYAKLKKHGRDYRKWAYGLKSVGYATDRTYAEKLIRTIERYGLNQFDR